MSCYPPKTSSMQAAKDLFFRYDGSSFYMSRDGVAREYARYNVPSSTERLWMEELRSRKLDALDGDGNWWVIHFLIHHGDYTCLPNLLAASPKGKHWEKTAFLEQLLEYLAGCRKRKLSDDLIEQGYQQVELLANALLGRARSVESKTRVQALINTASSVSGG